MIIGIIGKAGSGKTTAAGYFQTRNFRRIGFADGIKHILYKMGIWTWDELWHKKTEISRRALQEFGEWVRKYDFGYWTRLCELEIENMRRHGCTNVVIDDVRRIDEAEMIRKHGGILIRIYRDEIDTITDYDHISETEMDEIIPDRTIRNTDSFMKFYEELETIWREEGDKVCH